MNGKNRIVVKVAKQRDIKAIHPGGPAFQADFLADDNGAHRLDEDCISSDYNGTCTRRQA